MARNYRKAGDFKSALASFRRLAELGETSMGGLPAGLVARQGAALLFEETGQADELKREAAALAEALDRGRWPLTRPSYEFQVQQVRRWLGDTNPADDADRFALAEAACSAGAGWFDSPSIAPAPHTPVVAHGRPVLVLARETPDRLVFAPVGSRFLETAWLAELKRLGATQHAVFALTDAEGRAVLGDPNVPVAQQSVRTASATRLPWTVHAISSGAWEESGLPGRSRLLLAGILLMALLVAGGVYFTSRAMLREMAMARLQADFVASVSHEFRTPLTTMRQLSEMLAQGRISSEERRNQFYGVLQRESDRLHRLVEGLLRFGRMEAGQMRLEFEPLDAAALVREVAGDFQSEAAKSGHQVEAAMDGAPPRVRGDRDSLGQVLWNLLDNAVKYSPGSGTVWVEAAAADGGVAIRVRDRGLGIPPEEQERIFSKFVRGAEAKNAAIPGTGVGLAMARQIVEAHGGQLKLESSAGEGSVFTILLPSGE